MEIQLNMIVELNVRWEPFKLGHWKRLGRADKANHAPSSGINEVGLIDWPDIVKGMLGRQETSSLSCVFFPSSESKAKETSHEKTADRKCQSHPAV